MKKIRNTCKYEYNTKHCYEIQTDVLPLSSSPITSYFKNSREYFEEKGKRKEGIRKFSGVILPGIFGGAEGIGVAKQRNSEQSERHDFRLSPTVKIKNAKH